MTYRYKTVKRGGKTKLLHRHLVEQKIGRPLRDDEHVHHRNEERWDNSDGNLQVKPALVHIREHAEERRIHPRVKNCVICGTEFTPRPCHRKRKKTCSPPCANQLRSQTERATKRALAEALVRANVVDQREEAAA